MAPARRRTWRPVALIILILLLLGLAKFAKTQGWLGSFAGSSSPNPKLHQAVFLTNGQVYFGKIKSNHRDQIVLTDIYYLQVVNQPLQQQTGAQGTTPAPATGQTQPGQEPALNLVKIGSEIHGPVDKMVIPKVNVVFWEDIKTDGVVGKAIDEFKNRQTTTGGTQAPAQQQVPAQQQQQVPAQ